MNITELSNDELQFFLDEYRNKIKWANPFNPNFKKVVDTYTLLYEEDKRRKENG